MSRFFSTRWRGLVLLWAVWFYFLIFAQFGFLHRIESHFQPWEIECILGAMALSGITGALLCAYRFKQGQLRRWISIPLLGAAVSAFLVGVQQSFAGNLLAAVLTGLSLGVLTVSVVGFLAAQCPRPHLGLLVGMGTGLAYWTCNLPVIFNASPVHQCWLASAVCLLVLWIPWHMEVSEIAMDSNAIRMRGDVGRFKLLATIGFFLALIWTDSAAFAQIQSLESLKQMSWGADAQLWSVGLAHLVAAVVAGYWMDRGMSRHLYLIAFAALLLGYVLITRSALGLLGTLIYASGVSIYSTGLVAFALVSYGGRRPVWRTGWVYAIAGWLGSVLGIGMVEDLGRLPFGFWCLATLVVAVAFLQVDRKVAT